jgi:hypothetical protein
MNRKQRRMLERIMMRNQTLRFLWQLFTTEYGLASACGDTPPIHFAASNQLQVMNPLSLESGLIIPALGSKLPGVPWGLCGPNNSGGLFMMDEIQMWQQQEVANCNSVTFGKPGTQKSTANKFATFVRALIGYNNLVVDRTGEYTALVNLINRWLPGAADIVRFSDDPITGEPPNVYINPLDPDLGSMREVRFPLITALLLIAMGKVEDKQSGRIGYRNELSNQEDSLLWAALEELDKDYKEKRITVPLLGDLEKKLRRPTEAMAEAVDKTVDEARLMAYEMFLAVRKLTTGRLKGTFHEPTTPGVLQPRRLLVLNCQGVKDERVVITTMILNFFIMSQLKGVEADPSERIHYVRLDELWDMLAHPGMVDSLRIIYKQSGKLAVAVDSIMHNEQDAEVGTDITAITGLFADSDFRWLYRMNRNQLEERAGLLGVNERQIDIVAGSKDKRTAPLKNGQCLLLWGEDNSLLLEQRVWPEVLPVCDTRWMMRRTDIRETPLPRAQDTLPMAA